MKIEERFPVMQGGGERAVALIQNSLGGADITPFDLEIIKIPAGGAVHFQVLDDNGEEDAVRSIDGIVVFQRRQRAYWIRDDPDGSAPDCFSDDTITGTGDRIGNGESTTQLCKDCPFAQWGSDRAGGKGQDCGLKNLLFILRPGEFLPTIMLLPPTSIKVWHKFLLRQASRGIPLTGCVVEISLEKKSGPKAEYSCIKVAKKQDLDEGTQLALVEYAESLRSVFTQIRVGMDDVGE